MTSSNVTAVLEQALEPIGGCLTPTAAGKLLKLKLDKKTQARLDVLADKNTGRRVVLKREPIVGRADAGARHASASQSAGVSGYAQTRMKESRRRLVRERARIGASVACRRWSLVVFPRRAYRSEET